VTRLLAGEELVDRDGLVALEERRRGGRNGGAALELGVLRLEATFARVLEDVGAPARLVLVVDVGLRA